MHNGNAGHFVTAGFVLTWVHVLNEPLTVAVTLAAGIYYIAYFYESKLGRDLRAWVKRHIKI